MASAEITRTDPTRAESRLIAVMVEGVVDVAFDLASAPRAQARAYVREHLYLSREALELAERLTRTAVDGDAMLDTLLDLAIALTAMYPDDGERRGYLGAAPWWRPKRTRQMLITTDGPRAFRERYCSPPPSIATRVAQIAEGLRPSVLSGYGSALGQAREWRKTAAAGSPDQRVKYLTEACLLMCAVPKSAPDYVDAQVETAGLLLDLGGWQPAFAVRDSVATDHPTGMSLQVLDRRLILLMRGTGLAVPTLEVGYTMLVHRVEQGWLIGRDAQDLGTHRAWPAEGLDATDGLENRYLTRWVRNHTVRWQASGVCPVDSCALSPIPPMVWQTIMVVSVMPETIIGNDVDDPRIQVSWPRAWLPQVAAGMFLTRWHNGDGTRGHLEVGEHAPAGEPHIPPIQGVDHTGLSG